MEFWKGSAITSRNEEFWNDTLRETMAVGKKMLWVMGKTIMTVGTRKEND
jgi:hypothetical protein